MLYQQKMAVEKEKKKSDLLPTFSPKGAVFGQKTVREDI